MDLQFSKLLVCIGSQSLEYLGLANRTPNDLDLIGSYDNVITYCKSQKILSLEPIDSGKKIAAVIKNDDSVTHIEAEITWRNSSAKQLMKLVLEDPETKTIDKFLIPSIHVLYLLKMSHRYLRNSPFFRKTMDDIHYLRSLGAQIKESHRDFYRQRMEETYDYQHPKLNVNKSDFFNGDGIQYVYDHDSIHEAVKRLERPAYTYFKKENEEVLCSRKLFFKADETVRLYSVLEEAYVLALERSQIPFRGQVDPRKSFEMALMKVCTSITSGWFREYAWENYYQVLEMFDDNYAYKFFEKADKGLVKIHGT